MDNELKIFTQTDNSEGNYLDGSKGYRAYAEGFEAI